MKKIFRMSMVLALAASALVYTGCTKDYSEQLSKIDSTLTDLGKKHDIDIQNLDAAIKSLEAAKADKSALEAAVKDANDKIEALKKQAADDLAKLRADHNADVKDLTDKIATANAKIAELEKLVARVQALEVQAGKLEQSIANLKETHEKDILAVKSELQKAYDELKGMIEAEKAAREAADSKLAEDLSKEIARAEAAEAALAKDVEKIFGDIKIIKSDIDSLFKAVAATDKKLDEEIEQRKKEDAALLALIEACYTKEEVDEIVAGLTAKIEKNEADIKDLQEKKMDIAAFEEWLAETYAKDMIAVNAKIDAEIIRATKKEGEIEQALADYKEDMELVVARIYSTINDVNENLQAWCQANEDALNAYKEEMEGTVALIYSTINDVQTTLGAWIESVENDLNAHKLAYNAKMAEIDKAIADANEAIAALAARIQAISFVPEYVKGSAPVAISFVPMNGTKALANVQTVQGNFQVEPAAKTQAVVDAIKAGDAYVVYVPVSTKAAAAPKKATLFNASVSNGLVLTTVNVPTDSKDIAIALVYKKDGNEVVSDYVAVAQEAWTPKFAFIKDGKPLGDQVAEEPWIDAPAEHKWYEGATLKVTSPYVAATSFYTIAEIAKMFGLTEAQLTPSFKVTYTELAQGGVPANATKALVYANGTDYTKDAVSQKDAATSRKNIGEKVQGDVVLTLEAPAGNKVDVLTLKNTYEIIKRQINAKIEDYTLTWNYKNIDKLSSAHTSAAYLNKAVDKNFDEKLREMKVTIEDPKYATMDLDNIINKHIGSVVTKVNNATVSGFTFNVDATAYIEAQLAAVSMTGYKGFFTTSDAKKEIKNTYVVSSEEDGVEDTDVNVIWNVTFTAKDKDGYVTIPALGLFDYQLGDILKDVDLAVTRDAMYKKVEKFDAPVATWWAQFGDQTSYVHQAFRRAKPYTASSTTITNTSAAAPTNLSYFKVYGGTKSQVVLLEKDIKAMSDRFGFYTQMTTWYGVKYTWQTYSDEAGNGLKPLSFKLAYWPELSKVASSEEYDGKLAGVRIAELSYDLTAPALTVNRDNLSRYFRIEGLSETMTAAQLAKLTVTYERVNADLTATGHMHGLEAPRADGAAFNKGTKVAKAIENTLGKVADTEIDWNNYDGRDLDITASLSINGVGGAISCEDVLPITLVIEDPIKIEAVKDVFEVERVDYADAVAVLNENVAFKAVHRGAEAAAKANLFNPATSGYITLAGGQNAGYFYGLVNGASYPQTKMGEVRLGSKDGDIIVLPETTLWYDAPSNRLTYHLDSALLQQDLYVKMYIYTSHYYDWFKGVEDEHQAEYWVRIYQNK